MESPSPIRALQTAISRDPTPLAGAYWEMYQIACTCGKRIGSYVQDYEFLQQAGMSRGEALDQMSFRRPCCRRTFFGTTPILMYQQDPEVVRGRSIEVNAVAQRDQVRIGRNESIPIDPLTMARETPAVPHRSESILATAASAYHQATESVQGSQSAQTVQRVQGAQTTQGPVMQPVQGALRPTSVVPPLDPRTPISTSATIPGISRLPGLEQRVPVSMAPGVPTGNLRSQGMSEIPPWTLEGRRPHGIEEMNEWDRAHPPKPRDIFVGYGTRNGKVVEYYTRTVVGRSYGT